ncbi:lipid-transfer protein [Mycolicibacterium chitae]|uniref:Lipid-transfer protein n=1 Tax=Mycolicibacterium chitae TaxID=1792 RepID=A0A448IA41_MYCCI|nr:transporter [Mycolicibacterium chitae]MCV7105041.1 transporter [Mycolicibacterium chitae]BBZ05679.1 lipid-transfer protein [Mycolicibacterium chitae]VEG49290.1 lipid-transfer protein [Mycolicibacterium chitae]
MSTNRTLRGKAAVVGIGSTPYRKRGDSDKSALTLILEAILAACSDAGVDPRQIDGFVSYANDRSEGPVVGTTLGVNEIRWSTMVWGGGGGGVAAAVNAAATAVAAGQADCVVVYRGITEADDGRGSYGKGHFPPLLSAHGIVAPAQVCAMRTQRLLEIDGVPPSAMKALVMASYQHAQNNPAAVAYGKPLDSETYESSRWVAEPLHLFDCSRENDAASALLIVSAERARDFASVPAYVLAGVQGAGRGWGESIENEDNYTSAGFHPAMVSRLWNSAEVKAGDVDVVQVYENFSGPAVASLIDFGLCPAGSAAGEFMTLPNLLADGGKLPINTAGGNIAEGFVHGIGMAVEAVRQVRGSSPNQVKGAEVSLLLGGPVAPFVSATMFGSAATL